MGLGFRMKKKKKKKRTLHAANTPWAELGISPYALIGLRAQETQRGGGRLSTK